MTTLTCDMPETTNAISNSRAKSSLDLIVAVDGSESSIVAAKAAGRLADEWDCHLHLVSVLPPFSDFGAHPEGDQSRSEVEDLRIQLRESAIRRTEDRLNRTNDWSHEVVVGRLPDALVNAADRRGACVILWSGNVSAT